MKKCSNCGTLNPGDAKFCESCGTALSTPVTPTHSCTTTTEGNSEGVKPGLGILSFIIPLVGIILGITYMNDSNPAKKAAGRTYLYLGIGGLVLGCLILSAGGGGY